MDRNAAQIILGDERALANLAARHPNPLEAIKATLEATKEVPAIVRTMGEQFAALVAHKNIAVENGTLKILWTDRIENGETLENIAELAAKVFTSTDSVGNTGRWILGNIAHELGKGGYSMEDLLTGTELAYNTIITSRTVFRFFSDQRYRMPFSHHKEICYAKDIPVTQKHQIAKYAADNGLALTSVRQIIKGMQAQLRDVPPATILTAVDEAADEIPGVDTPEELYAATKDIDPEPEPAQFCVVSRGNCQLVSDRPSREEMEEADAVYEIRRILKARAGGGGPAEGAAGEAGERTGIYFEVRTVPTPEEWVEAAAEQDEDVAF